MISIFIMLIVAISLVAGVGYATLTLIRSGEASLLVQKNQVVVETVAASVRSGLSFGDGRILVPVATDGDGDGAVPLHAMPDVAPRKDTAYGRPFVHCPVGEALGATVPNWTPSGEADPEEALPYPALVLEGPNGLRYVAATGHDSTAWSEMRNRGIVAFILSPPPNALGTPDCRDVFFADPENGDWTLVMPDGSGVTAIYASPPWNGMRTLMVGDPEGFDLGPDPLLLGSLEDAARYASRFGVQAADIRLQPGPHSVSAAGLASLASGPASRSVEIKSLAAGATVDVTDGPAAAFQVKGSLSLEHVAFDPADSVSFDVGPSGSFVATGLEAEGVTVTGGAASLVDVELGSVTVSGGTVRLGGDSGIRSRIAVAGGNLHLANGDLIVIASDQRPFSATGNGTVSAAASPYPVTVVDPLTDVPSLVSYVPGPVSVSNEDCGADPWTCAAECPVGKEAVSGGCWLLDSSVNPLIGSGASADGTRWQCAWSGVPDHIVSPPGPKRAQALCQ